MKKSTILLVEDDSNLGYVIQDNLKLKGFNVIWCKNGVDGLAAFNSMIDLCLLDVMLPQQDGFHLAEEIRKMDFHTPILFLTAKGMIEDKLKGFRSGGDDYIVKPFSIEELVCRIEVFLKRKSKHAHILPETFSLGNYFLDFNNLTLKHDQWTKTLTIKEADILKLLLENQDRILKREEILISIWGDDDYFAGRSLDVFISKLRKYLNRDESLEIMNYHGIGFKLVQHF